MVLKRGYLWPYERDDLNALRQAVILFISDMLRKTKTEQKGRRQRNSTDAALRLLICDGR
jgi:hypothetical protein